MAFTLSHVFRSSVTAIAAGLLLLSPVKPGRAETSAQIDLADYQLTYADEFDSLSVSPWGPVDPTGKRSGTTRWIAHTPWNGDFGSARFTDPLPGFPFSIENGVLRIIALKNGNGEWRSGLLAGADRNGNGFKQSLGYFEIRTKLPKGPGTWPAFWLIGDNDPKYKVEIDVFEHYGHAPTQYHSVLHIWAKDGKELLRKTQITQVPNGVLYSQFNTFGVDVRAGSIAMYFNGRKVWETDVPDEFRQPLYPLVNLALGSGWPIDQTPNPSYMYVDYIRIYQKKTAP